MFIAGAILVMLITAICGMLTSYYLTTGGGGGQLSRLLPSPIVGTAGGWGFMESGAYSYMTAAWQGSLGVAGYLLWGSILALLFVWAFNLLATKESDESPTLVR